MASEWPQVPLGEVITLQRGFDLPSQDRKAGSVPILSSSGITGYHSEVGVPGPGVVTGRYGTIGQVFLCKEDFWPLNTTLWVKDFHGNDPLWASYLLRTIDFMSCSDKSSVPGVNRNDLHRILVLLPPLDEQRAIAGVLGAPDDKIEQNRQTARTLERLARTIFRAWFVDFEPVKAKAAGATSFPSMPQPVFDALPTRFVDSEIGPVPERWEVKALSSVCTLVGGGTPKRSESAYWGGNVPWYSVKDAPSDGEIWVINTSERITDHGLANCAARLVPKGCTIISARGTVGKLAMAGNAMAFNQSCYGLLPGDGKSFGYLRLLLQAAVAQLQQRTHGSVFDTITRATFDGLIVAKPKGDVVSAFEVVVAPLLDALLASLQESSKLAEMRDYLLPKLLSGQVRVEVACRSRIRHQAAAGSWAMPRQWEIQRTWLNSARVAVRSPAKPNGV